MTASSAMFAAGTRVRVRLDWPETPGPCHIRTPHYVRGREGVIERALGRFRNPEKLAFARPAEELALYHVRFDLRTIWPEAEADLLVELYDSWLEAA